MIDRPWRVMAEDGESEPPKLWYPAGIVVPRRDDNGLLPGERRSPEGPVAQKLTPNKPRKPNQQQNQQLFCKLCSKGPFTTPQQKAEHDRSKTHELNLSKRHGSGRRTGSHSNNRIPSDSNNNQFNRALFESQGERAPRLPVQDRATHALKAGLLICMLCSKGPFNTPEQKAEHDRSKSHQKMLAGGQLTPTTHPGELSQPPQKTEGQDSVTAADWTMPLQATSVSQFEAQDLMQQPIIKAPLADGGRKLWSPAEEAAHTSPPVAAVEGGGRRPVPSYPAILDPLDLSEFDKNACEFLTRNLTDEQLAGLLRSYRITKHTIKNPSAWIISRANSLKTDHGGQPFQQSDEYESRQAIRDLSNPRPAVYYNQLQDPNGYEPRAGARGGPGARYLPMNPTNPAEYGGYSGGGHYQDNQPARIQAADSQPYPQHMYGPMPDSGYSQQQPYHQPPPHGYLQQPASNPFPGGPNYSNQVPENPNWGWAGPGPVANNTQASPVGPPVDAELQAMRQKLELAERQAQEAHAARLKAEQAQAQAEQMAHQKACQADEATRNATQAKLKSEAQVESLSSRLDCVICLDAPCNVVLSPCMHVCCCVDCGAGLSHCPQCRAPIETQSRVYLP